MSTTTTPTTPSGVFTKLLTKLRTPRSAYNMNNNNSSSTPTLSKQTPPPTTFNLSSVTVNTIQSISSSSGHKGGDNDNEDDVKREEEYEDDEDVPIPDFECDWMNDEWSAPRSNTLVTSSASSTLPTTILGSASASLTAVSLQYKNITTTTSYNHDFKRTTPLSTMTNGTTTRGLVSTAMVRSTSGSGSTTTSSFHSSSSNVGSNSGGSGSSGSLGIDGSGDRVRKNSILNRSVGRKPAEGEENRAVSAGMSVGGSRTESVATLGASVHTSSDQNDLNGKIVKELSSDLNTFKSPDALLSTSLTSSRSQNHHRNTSADRILTSSQISTASTTITATKLDSVTPGFPRAATARLASKWRATAASSNGKPLRRAARVFRSDQDAADDEAESETGNQTTSPEGQEPSLSTPAIPSPPMMHARPRSDLPASTSASSALNASTSASSSTAGTMNPSAYINRDTTTRSRSAMSNHRASTSTVGGHSSASDISPLAVELQSSLRSSESLRSRFPASTSAAIGRQLVGTTPDAPIPTYVRRTSISASDGTRGEENRRNELNDSSSSSHHGSGGRMEDARNRLAYTPSAMVASSSRQGSVELTRSTDRESTMLPNRSGSSLGHYGNSSSVSSRGGSETSPQENGMTTAGTTMDRSSTIRHSNSNLAGSMNEPPQPYYQDENQYGSRSNYPSSLNRQQHHVSLSTPSYHTSSNYQQQAPASSTQTQRPILGETYRASNVPPGSNQPQQQPLRSSKSSSTYPNERILAQQQQQQQQHYQQQDHQDSQAPLRDRSPGIAEATPSQHPYYHSQSNHHPQQQQYQPHPSQQQQQQNQQQHQHHQQQSVPIAPPATKKKASAPLYVNGQAYHRAGLLGKGGSSRVYRVLDGSNNLFAIKRVDIGRNDAETRASFLNEIQLLEKLKGNPQIIRLIDSEMNEAKKTLMMVMEVGEADLNGLLADHLGKRISMNFIRYIWEQMLEAVQVIHNENVVHTDLKPANFVLVKGHLKLIDFGISKAIANDTTNIGRDQQIGTANYMPPEALMDSGMGVDGKRLMKLGRAADVWSLGCILHQMVYGHTPFSHFKDVSRKILAIQNPLHVISFPLVACPLDERGEEKKGLAVKVGEDLVEAMKGCLRFDHKLRVGIPELLNGRFLRGGGGGAEKEKEKEKENNLPTVDEETMKLLVDRVTKSVTGKLLSNEDGKMMANKLMKELREARPNR